MVSRGYSFSIEMSTVGDASVTKARLVQGVSSPSGKMTICPEIVIPNPEDPTAILLQQSSLSKLSERLRVQAKASAAFVSGTIPSLRQFVTEQESARGNFPGPIPIVYCNINHASFTDIAEAGACGVVLSVNDGHQISKAEEITDDLISIAKSALGVGLQPVPEVILSSSEVWGENEVTDVVEKIKSLIGEIPAVVILTLANDLSNDKDGIPVLPSVPKQLQKEISIIGSVRTTAGEGRIGAYVKRLKESGFTGAYLRSECVPSVSSRFDMEFTGNFWNAAISDLKSVRSKTFGGFRAKNEMDKKDSFIQNWATYQNALVEGDILPSQSVPNDLHSEGGDYKGF